MKKFSKLVALILAITMVVSMLPVFASAEDEIAETTETVEAVAETEAPAEEAEAPAEPEAPAEAEAEVAEAAEPEAVAEELTEAVEPEAEVQEVLPEVKEELKEEEKEEIFVSALDGDEVEGTVAIDSNSDYASFTRTFTAEDLTQKAAGKLVKVQVGSGEATYHDTLNYALVASTISNTGGARVITLLGDIAMTDANGYSKSNCLTVSGTNADWGSKNYGNLTFDLNGYTLSYSGGEASMFNTSRYGFTLKNGNVDYDGTSTRSVIAVGTSSTATATSGGQGYTPSFTLENLTISANSSGAGSSVIGSQVWGTKVTIDHCEIYNGKYAVLSFQGTTSKTIPTDKIFRPQLTVTNSMVVGGATYPLYIVKPDGATGGMAATVSLSESLLVSNYSGKLMINAAFGTAGGTLDTPSCGTLATDDWTGTAFDGTELTGLTAFYIQSGWDVTFDPANGEAATTTKVAHDANPTISAPMKDGYIFTGWSDGETTYAPGEELPTPATTGAITYTAQWTEASSDAVEVAFVNYNGMVLQEAAAFSVGAFPSYNGATPERPITATHFYTFTGWSTDGGETVYTVLPAITQADFEAGTAITYTAVFTAETTPWNYVTSEGLTVGYATLIDAFHAFEEDTGSGTFMLMADYTLTAGDIADTANGTFFMNDVQKAITIDLCGHTLTNPLAKRFLQITASVAAVFKSTGAQGTIDAQENTHFMYLGADAAGACDITASVKFQNVRVLGSTNNGKQFVITRARNVTVELEDCYVQCAGAVLSYGEAANWDSTNRDVSFTVKFTNATVYGRFLAYIYPNSSVDKDSESKYDCTVSMQFAGLNNFYYYFFTNGPVEQGWGINYNPINKSSNVDYTLNLFDPDGDDYACAPIDPSAMFAITNNTTADKSVNLFGSDDANGYYCVTAATGNGHTVTWVVDGETEVETVLDTMHPMHEAPAIEGYIFTGWSDGETTYAPGDVLPCPTADVTYTAQFTTPPFAYTSSTGETTYYSTITAAYSASAADLGQGFIMLMTDWTLDEDDHQGSNHIIYGPTYSVTLDLNGHTLTNDSNRNLFFINKDNVFITLKSDAGVNGKYVQTNKQVAATGNRSLIAFGATSTATADSSFNVGITLDHVDIEQTIGATFASYMASPTIVLKNGTYTSGGDAFISFQGNAQWTEDTVANPTFTLENISFTGIAFSWINHYSKGAITADHSSATINLVGTNSIKFTNADYSTQNGMQFRRGSAYISMIDPANGYVSAQEAPYVNAITLNGAEKDDGDYWTVTTSVVVAVDYTVSWDTDGNGVVDSTETVSSATHPTHADPEKEGFVFAGWSDGTTTYAPDAILPFPTADVTYTAVFVEMPFAYVSSTGETTLHPSLTDAYENGRALDEGQGTIVLRLDWTLVESDHNDTNHILLSPSKDIVLDLNGHTLTNDSNRNLVYADKDGFSFTLKSTGEQGGYVQTNKAVAGTTNRSLVAIGGTSVGAVYTDRAISVTIENVHAVMQKGSLCMSYLANPSYTVRNSTIESADVAFSIQASTGWTAETTSNPTLTFENVTVTGKGTVWCNRYTRGGAVLANMSGTINLAGTNVFKTNNTSYKNENGFRLYTRYEGDSAGQYDVISMIDPANGYVTEQEAPYVNIISLNGAEKDDGDYWTVTTTVATLTNYTVSWDIDGDGIVDITETVANSAHPTHEDPVKANAVFAGWSDGTKTYTVGAPLPCPTADVTYTAQFTNYAFSYTAGDSTVTQYFTLKDAFEASEADNGLGVITMLDDYTLQQVDWSSGSNYFVPTKNVTIDFAGHTLTDAILPYYNTTAEEIQGVNVFFVQADGITLTFTSSAGRGSFVKSTQRAFVAFGGSGNSTTQANRQGTVVVNNVDLTQTHASASFTSYMARVSMSFTDTTITSPNGTFMSFQSNKNWTDAVTSNYALTLNNVTFTGKAFFWASTIANSSSIPTANCTASVTLAGTNSIKFTDAGVAAQNGMQYRNRAVSYWSLINPANGHVAEQEIPLMNIISFNGTEPDDGEYFTVTTSVGTGHTVTWHLLDGTTLQTAVLDGAAPTAPSYALENLDTMEGWSRTVDGVLVNLAEESIRANTDFYMVGELFKTEADFVTDADKAGYISVQIGDDTFYGRNFTPLFNRAVGNTATFTFYTDYVMGSDGTVGSGNAWNTVTNDSNLTFNLNGHTLETVTDSAHKGFDRTLFTVTHTATNVQLTFVNGTLRANGGRHVIAIGTTASAIATNISFTAENVTFERTGDATQTDYLINVCAPANVAANVPEMPVNVTFTGCVFKVTGSAVGTVTRCVMLNKQASTGDLPATVFFNDCSFESVEKLLHFTQMDKTLPCVTIDADTAAALRLVDADISIELPLNGVTYTAGKSYTINPFLVDAETGAYTPLFAVTGYTAAADARTYTVTIHNEDEGAFRYMTKTTETEFGAIMNGTTDAATKDAQIVVDAPAHFDAESDERTVVTALKEGADTRIVALITIPYVSEGEFGGALSWKIDSFGELTIYGSGAMDDKTVFGADVKSVVISGAVTKLNAEAFKDTAITDVYYYGTAGDWDTLIESTGSNPFARATLHILATHDHAWVQTATTAATCTEPGTITYVCACGEEKTEYTPALGHDWDDGEIVTAPTATQAGVLRRTCRTCGETMTEVIPISTTVTVTGGKAKAGETVTVTLDLANNTGIAGMRLSVAYPEALTLTAIEAGDALTGLALTKPGDYAANPFMLLWDGMDADTSNGTLVTLTFTVAAGTADGTYPITVTYVANDVYDADFNNVSLLIVDGAVTVESFKVGDANGDGTVSGKDVTVMRRQIAGGYSVSINMAAADVNGDGVVTGKDVTILRRFIAGGYGIVLGG